MSNGSDWPDARPVLGDVLAMIYTGREEAYLGVVEYVVVANVDYWTTTEKKVMGKCVYAVLHGRDKPHPDYVPVIGQTEFYITMEWRAELV